MTRMPFGDPAGIRAALEDITVTEQVHCRPGWWHHWFRPHDGCFRGPFFVGPRFRSRFFIGPRFRHRIFVSPRFHPRFVGPRLVGPRFGGGFRSGLGGGFRGGFGGGFRGGFGGGGRMGGGGGMGGGGRRSDITLKHDITLLGHLDNGLGFYRFSYNGSDKAYVGVMAHEVQTVMPGAVVRGTDGFLRVYYEKLGLQMQSYEDWKAAGGKLPATSTSIRQ